MNIDLKLSNDEQIISFRFNQFGDYYACIFSKETLNDIANLIKDRTYTATVESI